MAKKQIRTEIITDDLDGSELSEGKPTIHFGIDGVTYAIDLGVENEAALRDALAPFIEVATAVRGGGSGKSKKSSGGSSPDAARFAAIREWAAENGIEVSARGRIKSTVIEAFEAAK